MIINVTIPVLNEGVPKMLARRGLALRPDFFENCADMSRKSMERRLQKLRFDLLEADAPRIIDELKLLFSASSPESNTCFITDIGQNDPAFKFIMPLLSRTCLMRQNGESITVLIPAPVLEALERHSREAAIKASDEAWEASKKAFFDHMERFIAKYKAEHESESEEPTP